MAKVGKFRVLAGVHSEGYSQGGRPLVFKSQRAGGATGGDVANSDVDLCKLNKGGCLKFERVSDSVPETYKDHGAPADGIIQSVLTADASAAPSPTPAPSSAAADPFADMSVEELRKLAAEEEVDLGKAAKRDDIVAILRKALAKS